MKLNNFLIRLLLVALFLLSNKITAAEPPPVRCAETNGFFILDNGILRAEISQARGNLVSLRFHGRELLAQDGGYWSSVGRSTPGHAASIRLNKPDRIEVSCQIGNVAGATNISLDTDYRYALARGESVIYVSAVLHHAAGNPAYGTGESRYCLKLNPRVFDFLAVDKDRFRLMPSGYDWDHGTQLNLKEARRMNTGIHAGEVEHKYDYSAMLAETPAYGWFGSKTHLGLWLINPSQEYIGGGPTKVELTGHLDVNPGGTPTLLNMWQGSHYGGTSLAVGANENWTKVIGPFAIFCNSEPSALDAWQNALAQAVQEAKQWPYAWVNDPNYPSASQRGTVAGQIVLRDAFAPEAQMSNVWVGVAAPDYLPPRFDSGRRGRGTNNFDELRGATFPPVNFTNRLNRYGFPPLVDWQRDSKFYQFWTRADADGRFTIPNVRPGLYTLHAFADGVMGEFALTNISVVAGQNKSLGQLSWQPERFGRTLWEIGIPDRTAREFLHGNRYWQWGLYYLYPQEFPNDVHFVIGQSDWRRDWNYVQPPRIIAKNQPVVSEDEDAGGTESFGNGSASRSFGLSNSVWTIEFNVTNQIHSEAVLRLGFAGAREGSHLEVGLNGQFMGDTGLLPATGVMHRDGIRGYWFERDITFPGTSLRLGTNTLTLKSFAHNWTQGILYDYLRLEISDK